MTNVVNGTSTTDTNTPWMQNKEWACGRIRSHDVAAFLFLWIVALLWNGFMGVFIYMFWNDPEMKAALKVMALFEFIGIFWIVRALKNTLAWLRYGGSILELASTPGVIGGTLAGRILTRLQIFPEKPFQITLTCTRSYWDKHASRKGESQSHMNTVVLWQTDCCVPPQHLLSSPEGLTIPFRIAIPYGLNASDDTDKDNQIRWRIAVSCNTPGVDFQAGFCVPVFITAQSNPDWTEEAVDEMNQPERPTSVTEESLQGKHLTSRMTVRPTRNGGTVYIFRMDIPLKDALLVPIVGALILSGAIWLYFWLGELGPFAVIPGVLGFLCLFAAVVMWTYQSRVTIEDGFIKIRKTILGIPRFWKISFSEIRQISVRQEMVEGGKKKDRNWDIEIIRKAGGPLKLGASVRERTEAVRLADALRNSIR